MITLKGLHYTVKWAWAREQFGVALPGVIRSDEPSSRRISIETWRIAIAARYQPEAKP